MSVSFRCMPFHCCGNISFTFFNQGYHSAVKHTVEYGKAQGDFKVDGRWTFEVGGRDKSFDRIADLPDSFVLADSMEFPVGKKTSVMDGGAYLLRSYSLHSYWVERKNWTIFC